MAPTREDVLRSTKFIYTAFTVRADDIKDFGALESDIRDMPLQVLFELSQTLKDGGLDGTATSYNSRTADVLERACKKVKSLAFLHPVLKTVGVALDEIITVVKEKGAGRVGLLHSMMIRNVVEQMHSPRKLYSKGFDSLIQAQVDEAIAIEDAATAAAAEAQAAAAKAKAAKANERLAKVKDRASSKVAHLSPDDSLAAIVW